MGVQQSNGRREQVVECPYCDEPILRRSLYGHVAAADDVAHEERGDVPDDYDFQTPDEIDTVSVEPRDTAAKTERIMCKWCQRTFNGTHGLDVHLGMKRGQGDHPEDTTAEESGVEITLGGGAEPAAEPTEPEPSPLDSYRQQLTRMSGKPDYRTVDRNATIPAGPLLDLLDELRQREGEAIGYYTAARELQDVLEEHQIIATR